MRIRGSYIIAILILIGIAGWMKNAEFVAGGQSKDSQSKPIAEREAERSSQLFKVRYVPLMPQNREKSVTVRGRTEADAVIAIRSETAGILQRRLVNKGDRVVPGDLVCAIERGVRQERVARAVAQVAQAKLDYEANSTLVEKGFTSKTKLSAMKYALISAKSALASAKWELSRTEIRANARGVVQDPIAEVGSMLQAGDTCVTLVNLDPILFVGQVSERDIGEVAVGMSAQVELVTGDMHTGAIRYIAPSADAKTRTFLVEIEVSNRDGAVRAGITATANIRLEPQEAYKISPAWLTLADSGAIGVRTVDETDTVQFRPVRIVAQTNRGFWVTGLDAGDRVISLGQEYVAAGVQVEAVLEILTKAEVRN